MKPTEKQKLAALRGAIKEQGLDGFIIPRTGEFQGEFVAAYAERLAWLTGFTGSAGTAVVLPRKAVILTDGRYTIQLAQQADKRLYSHENSQEITPEKWLEENAGQGESIGYDPWLTTPRQADRIRGTLTEKGIKLVAVEKNPVDVIWKDRPAFPRAKAKIFPKKFSGLSSAEKINGVRKALKQKKLDACIITLPDSLAWLLNIRGGDVVHTPVVLSFGIIHANGRVKWFVHPGKISPAVKKYLGKKVEIIHPGKMKAAITALKKKRVGLDFSRSADWFKLELGKAAVDFKDPCVAPKAIKNKAEQRSLRAAHMRDGAALVNFLYWLDTEGKKKKLTEMGVVEKLEAFRKKDSSYRGPSFDTISGWGANGAIVHYRATKKTNANIKPPGLLLLDSGGQYEDGTTDITRTIAIGKPTEEMKRHFTLVLKGHIAVARANFPLGTTGAQIDTLARMALWRDGLDYAHGTGHGVGCYLSVHEESASLSPRGTESIRAGMFLSNEPGYYKEGAYGIRIENLVLVRREGDKMLGFETFSLVPIDRALIKKDMLTSAELGWINAYHAEVIKKNGPKLEKEVRAWLALQASPL